MIGSSDSFSRAIALICQAVEHDLIGEAYGPAGTGYVRLAEGMRQEAMSLVMIGEREVSPLPCAQSKGGD